MPSYSERTRLLSHIRAQYSSVAQRGGSSGGGEVVKVSDCDVTMCIIQTSAGSLTLHKDSLKHLTPFKESQGSEDELAFSRTLFYR